MLQKRPSLASKNRRPRNSAWSRPKQAIEVGTINYETGRRAFERMVPKLLPSGDDMIIVGARGNVTVGMNGQRMFVLSNNELHAAFDYLESIKKDGVYILEVKNVVRVVICELYIRGSV